MIIEENEKMKRINNKMKDLSALNSPLEKTSVVNLVIERIKEAIINKEIKPGDYLPAEADLAQNLGVGKSSVREALKMLEAMGVVEIRQGSGTFIPKEPASNSISPLLFQLLLEQASAKDLIELRMIFEPAYTELAMERATEKDFLRIEDTIKLMEDKINNHIQTAEDDLLFHETIMDVTNNPLIINIGRTIHELFKFSISTSIKNIPEKSITDHKRILNAMRNKNKEELRYAILESYKGWIENIDHQCSSS